jgi:hypothetical protein
MTYVDGDDYTWPAPVFAPDLRTADQKVLDEIADLRVEVATLAGAFARLIDMLDVRPSAAPGTQGLPGGKAAVLITRRDHAITSRHVFVYHQVLHDAQGALNVLANGNWVFVHPTAASVVLDMLGVQA